MFKKIFILLVIVIVGFGSLVIFDYLRYSSAPLRGNIDTSKIGHETSLEDLGVDRSFLYQENAANDLVALIELYNEKYGDIEEMDVDLGDDVLHLLEEIGASEKIDLYEKYHVLPTTILGQMNMELLPLNNIRRITRRAIAKSDAFIVEGKKGDARRLLENVLIMGRFLQEDDTVTIYILVGLDVERQASEALVKISSGVDAERYSSYLLEIGTIKEKMSSRVSAVGSVYIGIWDESEGEALSPSNFAIIKELAIDSENKFIISESMVGLWYSSFLNQLNPFNWGKIFATKATLKNFISTTDDKYFRLVAKDILENGRVSAKAFKKAMESQAF